MAIQNIRESTESLFFKVIIILIYRIDPKQKGKGEVGEKTCQ